MVGGFVPDASVACVLSNPRLFDWVLYWRSRDGVHLVLAVSRCGTSSTAPAVVECASPGVIAGVIPVKDTPTSCASSPALDDESPISGDDNAFSSNGDAPASVDNAPAVVDDFSSSRRLFA